MMKAGKTKIIIFKLSRFIFLDKEDFKKSRKEIVQEAATVLTIPYVSLSGCLSGMKIG